MNKGQRTKKNTMNKGQERSSSQDRKHNGQRTKDKKHNEQRKRKKFIVGQKTQWTKDKETNNNLQNRTHNTTD